MADVRFDFSLPIPSTTAPHDWHSNGVVLNLLYAKVEGTTSIPTSPSPRNIPVDLPSAQTDSTALLPPAYEESARSTSFGDHLAFRTMRLVYNPNPLGNVNKLDESAAGVSLDLGNYSLRIFANEVRKGTCGWS